VNRESVYEHLPVALQNVACTFEGWRLGRVRYKEPYPALEAEYRARSGWSDDRLREFRDERLRGFLKHALGSVPYYRALSAEQRGAIADVRGLEDLRSLPVLPKEVVRADPARFEAPGTADVIVAHTSGTTGAGLRFPTTVQATREQWATWWRFRGWHGIGRDTWCGYFGGRSVVPADVTRPPYWRYNRAGRQILFSAYHLSPQNAPVYVRELRERRPPWLHGYPSMISLFGKLVLEQQLDLGYRPTWITVGAENLFDHQRAVITEAFGVRPRESYGMAEAVANASECREGNLHVDEDFAAVHSVTDTTTGEERVVGTNFTNPAFPLVNYEVGDVGRVGAGACSCGLPGRLLVDLDGRKEDFVILSDGARLGRLDHVFKDMINVREAQWHQSTPGEVTVSVVRDERYSDEDHSRLMAELRARMGSRMQVDVRYADRLERSATGKLRFVVNEIPEAQLSQRPERPGEEI
jgi:phenylacetate-coenzyme A ligase PaaK-like adenylate-forming protein